MPVCLRLFPFSFHCTVLRRFHVVALRVLTDIAVAKTFC